jgi:hypothetical protein
MAGGVMDFPPLRYAVGTVTIWHGLVLLGLIGLNVRAFLEGSSQGSVFHATLPGLLLGCFTIVWMYLIVAPVVGQLFGDKYPFAAVWPSALVLASTMSAAFVSFALTSEGRPMTLEFALFGGFAFVFAATGLTLFVCIAHYVMPRAAGFGLIDWPKTSWGVQL